MSKPTLPLAALVFALYAGAGAVPDALVLDHRWFDEPWRLLTGHLVHTDAEHLGWNLLALVGLGLGLQRQGGAGRPLLAGLLAVTAWWLLDGPSAYVGLSGVLNALFLVLAGRLWLRRGDGLALVAVLGLFGKIGWEMAAGVPLFTQTAWPPAPQAHLAGALGGMLLLIAEAGYRSATGAPRWPAAGLPGPHPQPPLPPGAPR